MSVRRPIAAALAVALFVPCPALAAVDAPSDASPTVGSPGSPLAPLLDPPVPDAATGAPAVEEPGTAGPAELPPAAPSSPPLPPPPAPSVQPASPAPADGNAVDALLRQLGAANPWRARLSDPLAEVREEAPAATEKPVAGELPFPLESAQSKYDIPVDYNESVAKYLAMFAGPGRKWFGTWLARASQYVPLFREILRQYAVPEDLVYLAMIESGFSPLAYSWAKASGPWQFIQETGNRYGLRTDFWVDERRDPIKATHAAARFLRRLRDEFGDWYLAWAAYNAGPGRVSRAIKQEGTRDFWELQKTRAFRKETQDYVPKLIAAALIAKQPDRFGFPEIERRDVLSFDEVAIPDATDLTVIARCAGVGVDEVKTLNPELKRWATPPVDPGAEPYRLRLPPGTGDRFAEAFARVEPSERFTFSGHVVAKGDTLGAIALRYGTSVEAISRANGNLSPRKLRLGQELVIPLPPGAKKGASAAEPPGRKVASAGPAPRVSGAKAADAAYHHLLPGETLGHLALRYGSSVEELRRWNRIRDVRKLRAGQRLRVR